MNLCLLNQLNMTRKCLNYHFVLTQVGIDHMKQHVGFFDRLKYCNASGYPAFIEYTKKRRYCTTVCGRYCTEENYDLVVEKTSAPYDQYPAKINVIIRPDRKLNEVVQHASDMDPYQLIGFLGGHAHLWLGLSAIQLYDVFYMLIVKIKHMWIRFVEW